MKIQVKCSCGEGNCPEWAIVELQGAVEAQPSFHDRLQNLQIGLLCRPSSQVLPNFFITAQILFIIKPFLVLIHISAYYCCLKLLLFGFSGKLHICSWVPWAHRNKSEFEEANFGAEEDYWPQWRRRRRRGWRC